MLTCAHMHSHTSKLYVARGHSTVCRRLLFDSHYPAFLRPPTNANVGAALCLFVWFFRPNSMPYYHADASSHANIHKYTYAHTCKAKAQHGRGPWGAQRKTCTTIKSSALQNMGKYCISDKVRDAKIPVADSWRKENQIFEGTHKKNYEEYIYCTAKCVNTTGNEMWLHDMFVCVWPPLQPAPTQWKACKAYLAVTLSTCLWNKLCIRPPHWHRCIRVRVYVVETGCSASVSAIAELSHL